MDLDILLRGEQVISWALCTTCLGTATKTLGNIGVHVDHLYELFTVVKQVKEHQCRVNVQLENMENFSKLS